MKIQILLGYNWDCTMHLFLYTALWERCNESAFFLIILSSFLGFSTSFKDGVSACQTKENCLKPAFGAEISGHDPSEK